MRLLFFISLFISMNFLRNRKIIRLLRQKANMILNKQLGD